MSSLSFVSSAVQTGTSDGGYEETPIESKETEEVNRRNAHKPLFEQLRQNQEDEDAKREEFQRDLMRGTCTLDSDDVAHLDAVREQQFSRAQKIQQQTNDELMQFRALKALRQQKEQEEKMNSAVSNGPTGAINQSNDLDDVIVDETDGADHQGLGYIEAVGQQKQQKGEGGSAAAVSFAPTLGGVIPKIKVKKRKRRTETATAAADGNGTKAGSASKKERPSTSVSTGGGSGRDGKTEMTNTSKQEAKTNTTKKDNDGDGRDNDKVNSNSSSIGGGRSGLVNSLLAGYGSSSDEED